MATTITSREFNHDTGRAKRAAAEGPVFITDRGRPAHVLMTVDDYRRLQSGRQTVAQLFEQTDADFDFDFEEFKGRELARPSEFDPA